MTLTNPILGTLNLSRLSRIEYHGVFNSGFEQNTALDKAVFVREGDRLYPLPWRSDLGLSSPPDWNWGYPGVGPRRLAHMILVHASGCDEIPMPIIQDFKFEVTATFPMAEEWVMTGLDVGAWIQERQL